MAAQLGQGLVQVAASLYVLSTLFCMAGGAIGNACAADAGTAAGARHAAQPAHCEHNPKGGGRHHPHPVFMQSGVCGCLLGVITLQHPCESGSSEVACMLCKSLC